MRTRLIAAALILFFLPQFAANAQIARLYESRYNFTNSQIRDVYQDRNGFIWVCGENGLTRFDGRHFRTLSYNREDEDGIASSSVLCMLEDSSGNNWIGTARGLQLFDKDYGTFRLFDLGDPEIPESTQYVSDIIEIDEGGSYTVIAATSQHGAYFIDEKTLEVDRSRTEKINIGLSSLYIEDIFRDSRNLLWIASAISGLDIYDLGSERPLRVPGMELMKQEAAITAFEEDDKSGDLFISTDTDGIWVYDASENRIRRVHDAAMMGIQVLSMLKGPVPQTDREDVMILGTVSEGFRFMELGSERLVDIPLSNIRYDTRRWRIQSLTRDNQGNVWAGVYQTGLFVLPAAMFGFEYSAFNPDNPSSESSECIRSILVDGSGVLWAGTDGYGIIRTFPDGRREYLSTGNSSLPSNSISSMVQDSRGTIWLSSSDKGLISFRDGRFSLFSGQDAVGTKRCGQLYYDKPRDYLYLGTSGNGFSIIDASDGEVLRTVCDDFSKWNTAFTVSEDGTLWVGTVNGICKYDFVSQSLVHVKLNCVHGNSRIYTLTTTTDGKVMAGCTQGLVEFDPTLGHAVLYTTEDGLSENAVMGIVEDDDGSFWISTMGGLNNLSRDRKTFRRYYQNDGLQDNHFSSNACFKDEDGKMYFGGIKGLTSFKTGAGDMREHITQKVFFTSLSVGGKVIEYDDTDRHPILDKSITGASTVTLPYSKNTFTILFTMPEYTNPMRVNYFYRLQGAEDGWTEVESTSRSVTYANLGHGHYTLQVKAALDGYPEYSDLREISVRIKAPFWLSTWAWLAYALMLALAGLLSYRWAKKRIIRKKEIEESKIKDEKLNMFTELSYQIKTPLTMVMGPLNTLRENHHSEKEGELYDLMYRNSLRILHTVNEIIDMQEADSGQKHLKFSEVELAPFIGDLQRSFENLSEKRAISIRFEGNPQVGSVWMDAEFFDKVMYNLLSNSYKFSPKNTEIVVSVSDPVANTGLLEERIPSYVEIRIENQSEHIPDEDMAHMFDMFYRSEKIADSHGTGIGLYVCRQLVELHHGKIWAENTSNGVRFTVALPLGCGHLRVDEIATAEDGAIFRRESEETVSGGNTGPKKESSAAVPKTAREDMRKIVVVDQDKELLDYFIRQFGDEYDIECHTDTQQAWAKVLARATDVVITDLKIQAEGDGLELCRKIKSNTVTNQTSVIVLTSLNDERTMRECAEIGVDKFFTKPISVELLRSKIAQVIATKDNLLKNYRGKVNYDYSQMKVNSAESKFVEKIIADIKENLDNSNYSVEDLSRSIGMSRVHLNRKLKETLNVSPSLLIKSIRLKQAAYLLINNKVNVSEVAYMVGFSTHSYFSSSFREYFGMTPKEFVAAFANSKDDESLKRMLEI